MASTTAPMASGTTTVETEGGPLNAPAPPASSRPAGFLRQSALSLAVKAGSAGLGFAVVVVLARSLGEAGYGLYAVVYATVTVLGIPAQMGLPVLLVRETARVAATGTEPGAMHALWRDASRLVLATTALIVAGAWLWFWAGSTAEAATIAAFAAGLFLIPARALSDVRAAGLRGLGRVIAGQIPDMILRPGLFLALIGAAVLAGMALEPARALALHLGAAALTLLVVSGLLARAAPRPDAGGTRAPNPMGLGAMLVSAGTLGLVAGAQILNANLDVIMLGALAETALAGLYKVAATTALLTTVALQAVNQVLMPRIAAAHKRGDRHGLERVVRLSARLTFGCAVIAALILILAGETILRLAFGETFTPGYTVLVILALGQLGNAAFGPVISVLNMTGLERETLRGVLIACAVNVVLNAALIPLYGAEGAAIATAITLLVWNAVLFVRVRARLGINTSALGRGMVR